MKKYVGLFLAIVLLAFAVCGCGNDNEGVVDNGNGQIDVSSDLVDSQNTIVSVPIILKTNPGFLVGNIIVEYDTDNFIFVEAKNSGMFAQCETNEAGGKITCMVQTAQTDLNDVNKTGTIVTLDFKIKENAKKGTYPIKVSEQSQFADSSEKWVTCEFEESKITVK